MPRAEAEQSADLVALRALTAGVRSRLPFGRVRVRRPDPGRRYSRRRRTSSCYGSKVPLGSMDAVLAPPPAERPPPSTPSPPASSPTSGCRCCRRASASRSAMSVMDRASATGLVPAALIGRWERAVEDARLWQFQPTVVNGSLTADSLLSANGESHRCARLARAEGRRPGTRPAVAVRIAR